MKKKVHIEQVFNNMIDDINYIKWSIYTKKNK
jgi:hypothetical protein